MSARVSMEGVDAEKREGERGKGNITSAHRTVRGWPGGTYGAWLDK